jgi:acetolactate synthase-1/2/3 large subunit
MQTDKTSCDHVVSTALSECLGKPLHTLFQVSTSAALVEGLYQGAVKVVFGIPGAKIDKVFDTLRSSSIRTVVCRHEQNAAFIAGGTGRLTGQAGVAIATSGLGVSNLTTGLATANSEHLLN